MSESRKNFSLLEHEQLINLIAQKPILFDLNNPEYKNSFKRDKVWEEIAQELNKTGEDCKSLWKNIKDKHYRQKLKNKRSTGSAAETYDRLLSFLQTVPQERTSIGNVPEINDKHSQSSSTSLHVAFSPESSEMVDSPGPSAVVISPEPSSVLADSESNTVDETQPNPIVGRAKSLPESPEANLTAPQTVVKKGTKRPGQRQDEIIAYLRNRDEARQKLIQKRNTSSSENCVNKDDEMQMFLMRANNVFKRCRNFFR